MFNIRWQVQSSLAIPRERQASRGTFVTWVLHGQNQKRYPRFQVVCMIRMGIVDGDVQHEVVAAIDGVCLEGGRDA